MEHEKIIEAISKTGFILEDNIRQILEKSAWSVITNRYYIDDQKGTEREIDILAYKIHIDESEKILYYTALIISCKKDNENYWVFLTRPISEKDPNFEYFPLHNISTDERLIIMLESEKKNIVTKLKDTVSLEGIILINKNVTAFQQIKKSNCACQNDKNIYDSIITTIKALEAEKINVNRKKGEYHVCYNFNLLTIFEGEMIEYGLRSDLAEVSTIDNIHYVNRHIINRRDDFYKIRFVNKNIFKPILAQYDSLCVENNKIYPALISNFYVDIFSFKDRVRLFWEKFTNSIVWTLNYEIKKEREVSNKIIDFTYFYSKDEELTICITLSSYSQSEEILTILNSKDSESYRITATKLKEFFRYEGAFVFDDDLPF